MSLADDIVTDLDNMILTAEFAVVATISGESINVIFNDSYEGVSLETQTLETRGPEALCKTADVTAVSHGTEIIINSITYKVRGIQPDGTGLTLLILSQD